MRYFLFCMIFVCCGSFLFAEAAKPEEKKEEKAITVTFILKNTDRITGVIEKFLEGEITVKTEKLGTIKFKWEEVTGVESSDVVYFRLENGNVIAGRAQGMEGDKLVIHSYLLGKVQVNLKQVLNVGMTEQSVNPDFLRVQQELKEKEEKLLKTTRDHVWSGYVDISFSGNEGNKNDRNFKAQGHIERKTDFDHFIADATIRYGQSRRETTVNEISGGLKESIDFNERLFSFGKLTGEWDEIEGIELLFTAQLGLGVHILLEGDWEVFKGDKITFDFELGGQFTSTDYENREDTQTGGIVVRFIYKHIFPNKWELYILGEWLQSFVAPDDDSDATDDYTLRGLIRFAMPLSESISLTATIEDKYKNIVDEDQRRNDFDWSLGIRVKF